MDEWLFCPKCGTKLDPADSACRVCGAATPSATTVPSGEHTAPSDDAELAALTAELREALDQVRTQGLLAGRTASTIIQGPVDSRYARP